MKAKLVIFMFLLCANAYSQTDHFYFVTELAIENSVGVIEESFVQYKVVKADTIEIYAKEFDRLGKFLNSYTKDKSGKIFFFTYHLRDDSGKLHKVNHNNYYQEHYTYKGDTTFINKVTLKGDTLESCTEFSADNRRDSIVINRCISRFGDVDSTVKFFSRDFNKIKKSENYFNSNISKKQRVRYNQNSNVARITSKHYTIENNKQSFLQSIISSFKSRETRVYSPSGELLEITLSQAGKTNRIKYEYDHQGNLLKIQYINQDSPNLIKVFYYNDFSGVMLVSKVVMLNEDGVNMGDYYYSYKFHK